MRVLAFVAVGILAGDPAEACKCTDPGLGADMQNATAVFVATIDDVTETKVCPPKGPQWCYSTYRHEARVESVWKGTPGKAVTLDTGSGKGDCSRGGNLGKGKRWLIFARGGGPVFDVRICAGNQLATPAIIDRMTKRFGEPKRS